MKLYGKYRGTVFSNTDPETNGRVKAFVPKAGFADVATGWADSVLEFEKPWTGPPPGTKIWVEFEAGDPNFPIWSGAKLDEYVLSQYIIEAVSIKLGKTAAEGLIKSSFGLNKYAPHTHSVTAVGSPTGPPLPPAIFVPATDATVKTKGE